MSERRASAGSFRRAAGRLAHSGRPFGYGLAAQLCSAATNFALIVVAAHVLGPGGLGTLLIGFATYVLALGFARALLSEPLVARSGGQDAAAQEIGARSALTLALAASVATAIAVAVIGMLLPDDIGRGMLVFAPWLVPALMQDVGRSIVFRDRQNRTAVYSDAAWLVVMGATIPVVLVSDSDWVITASWGIGALAGALVAIRQLRWRPIALRTAIAWWTRDAAHLARWLGSQQLLYGIVSYANVLLLAAVLGTNDYGGLRVVQSIFTPLTLLGPALALPGLPMVARVIREARRRALKVATKLALAITAVTAAYVVILYAIPSLLEVFFGDQFKEFRDIIVPIGVGQVLSAPAYGLTLFLKADQRGSAVFVLGAISAVAYLILTVTLGAAYGLDGAAWAAAATGAISLATLAVALHRSLNSTRIAGSERTA